MWLPTSVKLGNWDSAETRFTATRCVYCEVLTLNKEARRKSFWRFRPAKKFGKTKNLGFWSNNKGLGPSSWATNVTYRGVTYLYILFSVLVIPIPLVITHHYRLCICNIPLLKANNFWKLSAKYPWIKTSKALLDFLTFPYSFVLVSTKAG